MRHFSFHNSLVAVAAVILVFMFFSVSSNAQVRPKKTTPKPSPTATPLPGEAQIISTAADQNEPANYIGPPVPNPAIQQDEANAQKVKELTARVKRLESAQSDPYEAKQKRLLLNLDILTRAEQRSESLRKQLFDMIEKENSVKARLDQIEIDSRPEMINRAATFSGSMRPEEVREMRKRTLDSEKANLQALLTEIESTRASVAANLDKSDALVEKLRTKLEKDIDDSFKDEPQN